MVITASNFMETIYELKSSMSSAQLPFDFPAQAGSFLPSCFYPALRIEGLIRALTRPVWQSWAGFFIHHAITSQFFAHASSHASRSLFL
jgi:hypothetical protein